MRLSLGPALLAVALLAGCEKPDERKQAAGEILPGTITDAMIATDQTKADPPLAPRPTSSGVAGKAKATAVAEEDKPSDEATPAASPTPEATPAPTPAAT